VAVGGGECEVGRGRGLCRMAEGWGMLGAAAAAAASAAVARQGAAAARAPAEATAEEEEEEASEVRPTATVAGMGLPSFTSQLNLSALYGIGGARRGYVARVKGVVGGV
jgi:hypothetical protein